MSDRSRALCARLGIELPIVLAPDYRIQSTLSGPLRAAAARQGRPELMAMWAGQGHRLAQSVPAGEPVARFARQAGLVAA